MTDDDLIRRGDALRSVALCSATSDSPNAHYVCREAVKAIAALPAVDFDREILRLKAALWAIGHAAGIETKRDLQDAALAALEPQPAPTLDEALAALREIAAQKKTDELDTEYDVEYADFEGGYDACIDRARAALRQIGGE